MSDIIIHIQVNKPNEKADILEMIEANFQVYSVNCRDIFVHVESATFKFKRLFVSFEKLTDHFAVVSAVNLLLDEYKKSIKVSISSFEYIGELMNNRTTVIHIKRNKK